MAVPVVCSVESQGLASARSEGLGRGTHLGTCTGSGRDCNQRSESLLDGKSFANGGVDEVEELGIGVAGEEVGDFLSMCKCGVSFKCRSMSKGVMKRTQVSLSKGRNGSADERGRVGGARDGELTNDGSTTNRQEMREVMLLGKVDGILPPVLHHPNCARGELGSVAAP